MNWLIVTDLDGTLLDATYPIDWAARAVDTVAERADAHVALASSKTLPELTAIAGRCASDPLLIFENGAGIAWHPRALDQRGRLRYHDYEMECFGPTYPQLRRTLIEIRSQGHPFRGFGDMAAAEVAERTGLDPSTAADARLRMGTEPISWQGDSDALEVFRAELARHGLSLEQGGRFHHVSEQASKARAVARLRERLTEVLGSAPAVLACGDAPSDLAMLREADFALVFPGSDGQYLLPITGRVDHAPAAGPAPWLDGVLARLETDAQEGLAS